MQRELNVINWLSEHFSFLKTKWNNWKMGFIFKRVGLKKINPRSQDPSVVAVASAETKFITYPFGQYNDLDFDLQTVNLTLLDRP